jgi:hypothetical protein
MLTIELSVNDGCGFVKCVHARADDERIGAVLKAIDCEPA